jgi:hypothetical protein
MAVYGNFGHLDRTLGKPSRSSRSKTAVPGPLQKAWVMPIGAINERFDWFQRPVTNPHTRLVMLASANSGTLSVFGPHGERRVLTRRPHPAWEAMPVTPAEGDCRASLAMTGAGCYRPNVGITNSGPFRAPPVQR